METIVESLRSETPEIRAHATDELSRLVKDGLTVQEGLTALRGASHTFPPGKYDWLDSAAQLVGAASAQPVPEYIPVVLELYPTYNGKARVAALALLAKADSREAAEAWMSIVRTYARSGGVTSLPVGPLEQKPRYADVLFPEMLEYTDVESLATDIWHLCWTYCESGLLTSQSLLPYATRLVGAYRVLESALVQAQQSDEIGWMWDDTYLPTREAAGLLLDLMGYVPDPSVEEALRGALQLADPKPRAYAATSLVRLGKAVGTEDLLSIARSAEMRNVLHDR
ncbi:MAG: hypothetical protein GX557_10955, partial [Chloroflexi bacterium]|nr:hypothetical protein [Chloroflexota bacterium]